MNRSSIAGVLAVTVSLFSLACSNQEALPTAPGPSSAATQPAAVGGAASPGSAAVAQLTAVAGSGSGVVKVAATPGADGWFDAQITVNVHGLPPNTALYVQRAPEVGRPNSADGVCQRADGVAPWGPPAPSFVTFPLPSTGPLTVLETSPGGAGTVHLNFGVPGFADGLQFDVMFRLVDSLTNPTVELRTGCFTVTVK